MKYLFPHRAPRAALALTAAAALCMTAACSSGKASGGGDAGGDVTSISVLDYYTDTPDNQIFTKALDDCGKKVGVSVKREVVPGANLIAKVLQKSSSKTLPDLLMLDNPDLQQIAETGALTPLTDYGLSGEGYADGVVAAGTFDGKLYGLAPNVNTLSLFYNVKMLKDAGVEPPTTWDELRAAAKKLTQGSTYGLAFAAPANYEGTWQFLPFFWTAGADETKLDSPEAAQALQLWVDLVDEGSVSKGVVNWTQADVKDQFAAGNAAMMVNGPWQIPSLKEIDGLEYDVVTIPVPSASAASVAPLGGEVWTIPQSKDSARQKKAAEVLTCLLSDDSQLSLGTQRSTVPTKSALIDAYLKERPDMASFAEQVATARARTGKLGSAWPKTAEAMYNAVQSALTHKQSVSDALATAQSQVG